MDKLISATCSKTTNYPTNLQRLTSIGMLPLPARAGQNLPFCNTCACRSTKSRSCRCLAGAVQRHPLTLWPKQTKRDHSHLHQRRAGSFCYKAGLVRTLVRPLLQAARSRSPVISQGNSTKFHGKRYVLPRGSQKAASPSSYLLLCLSFSTLAAPI